MKRFLLLVILLGALLLSACGGESASSVDSGSAAQSSSTGSEVTGQQVSVSGGSYTRVSPDELQAMLEYKDFAFVNTHVPFEGDIPGTDLSIPYDQIDQNLDQLPADKDAKVVFYCRTGRMSTEAADTLVNIGYTNIWELEGGMVAWTDAGLPLEGA